MRKRNELQTKVRFVAENENCFKGEQKIKFARRLLLQIGKIVICCIIIR